MFARGVICHFFGRFSLGIIFSYLRSLIVNKVVCLRILPISRNLTLRMQSPLKSAKKKRLCNLHLKKKILPNLQKILKRTLLEKDPKLSLFSQIKRLHQKNLSRLPYWRKRRLHLHKKNLKKNRNQLLRKEKVPN